MEASFAAKPQALVLAPCASLSHPVSPAARLSFVRTRFLGSSHHLRPPGSPLCSRQRCPRLRLLRFRSHPLVVGASGASGAVVVVIAVLTVSAVSLFFFDLYARRKSGKRVTGERYIADSARLRRREG